MEKSNSFLKVVGAALALLAIVIFVTPIVPVAARTGAPALSKKTTTASAADAATVTEKDAKKKATDKKPVGAPLSAWLGVMVGTLDSDDDESEEYGVKSGAMVNDVVDGSPADKAGLLDGDIITEFGGQKISSAAELVDAVAESEAGEAVKMTASRDGKPQSFTVTLAERSDDDGSLSSGGQRGHGMGMGMGRGDDGSWMSARPRMERKGRRAEHSAPRAMEFFSREFMSDSYIGVNLQTVDGELAEYFGLNDGEGALIVSIQEESPARKAGLKAGDVITKIGDEEISSVDDAQEAVGEADEGDTLSIAILRDRTARTVRVAVAEREDSDGEAPRRFQFFGDDGTFSNGTLDESSFMRHPRMPGLAPGVDAPGMRFNFDDQDRRMRQMERELRKLRREMKKLQTDSGAKQP